MKRDTKEAEMQKREAETLRALLRSDIGAMIESLRADMNVQFEGVQAQFDDVRSDIARLDAKLERRTKALADTLAAADRRLRLGHDDHEARIVRLEQR